MTTNLTNIPVDEIRALVDERARYEGWIGALESRRGQTPPHVYDRVRGDYDGRLAKVMDRLGAFVSPLRAGESALAGREDELVRALDEQRDELSEIELRTAVGEYGEDEGARLRSAKESEVQALEGDRTEVQADLATVRELLGRSLPPGAQAPAAARAAAPPTPAAAGPAPAARQTPTPHAGVEALGDADAPWPEAGAEESAAREAEPRAEAQAAEAATTSEGDERPEYEEWSEGAAATAVASGAAAESAAAGAAGAGAARGQGASPATYPVAGMPDQEKTLRCPDCGAMNYPTEWYCEKCGGELAAL